MDNNEVLSPRQIAGLAIFALAFGFCFVESSPQRSVLQLGWGPSYFYVIMAIAGALSALIVLREYPIPGVIGGALFCTGSFYMLSAVYNDPKVGHFNLFLAMVIMGIGAIPGAIAFGVLALLQHFITGTPLTPDKDGEVDVES